jgi:hypothetical protein
MINKLSYENRFEQLSVEGSCGTNRLANMKINSPSIPCHLVMPYIESISSHISQLLVSIKGRSHFITKLVFTKIFQPKIKEREIEREKLRKEHQHYQDLWISLNEQSNRVIATKVEIYNQVWATNDNDNMVNNFF